MDGFDCERKVGEESDGKDDGFVGMGWGLAG